MNRRAQTWPTWALYAHQAGRLLAALSPAPFVATRIGAARFMLFRSDHRPLDRDSISP